MDVKVNNKVKTVVIVLLSLIIGLLIGFYIPKDFSFEESNKIIDTRRLSDVETLAILNSIASPMRHDDKDTTNRILCAHMDSLFNSSSKLKENISLHQKIYDSSEEHIKWLLDNDYCDDYIRLDK